MKRNQGYSLHQLSLVIILLLSVSNCLTTSGDVFQDQIDRFHELFAKDAKVEAPKLDEVLNLKEALKAGAFPCTGGKDPSKMGKKAYITAFNQGPCNPIMLLPGITASRLTVTINCEAMKKASPAAFADCGWTKCRGDPKTDKTVPQPEYDLWMPAVGSPVFFFNVLRPSAFKCFAYFFPMRKSGKKTRSGQYAFDDAPGASIQPYGMSNLSSSKSKCAETSIQDLISFLPSFLQNNWALFKTFFDSLKAAGYVNGLTAQAIPYDWRKSQEQSVMSRNFERIVDELYGITGKKVVISAHSMGNNVAYYNLLKMSKVKKEEKIKIWFAIGAPLLGTTALLQLPLSSKAFFEKLYETGVGASQEFAENLINGVPAYFELVVRPSWKYLKKEPWFAELMKRTAADDSKKVYKSSDPVVSLFPTFDQTCMRTFPDRMTEKCYIGIKPFDVFAEIGSEKITAENFISDLKKHSAIDSYSDFMSNLSDDRLDKGLNPGVEVAFVYGNHLNTAHKLVYKQSPAAAKKKKQFFMPEKVINEIGDGNVQTTSAMIFGIKWASEFNKKNPSAKRVSFVEFCSKVKRSKSLPQGSSNQYLGLNCVCDGKYTSFSSLLLFFYLKNV